MGIHAFIALSFVFFTTATTTVQAILVKSSSGGTHGEHTLQRCSLKQHTQQELKTLWGSEHRPAKCGSFLEMHSLRSRHRARGIDYVTFIESRDEPDQELKADANDLSQADGSAEGHATGAGSRQVVWVSGYPRSGSSTILSMVTAAGEHRADSRMLGETFSVFEPCHDGDKYLPWMEAQGCARLLSGIARCEFRGVEQLWGWADSHTTSNHSAFTPEGASKLCKKSSLVAFKTVDYGHNISEWSWFLDETPDLRIIDIVRDPRGIYASWKTTKPFDSLISSGEFYSLMDVCNTFASNLDLESEQVHRVVFEDLLARPVETMQQVYEYLGLPFGKAQEQWLAKTFNAVACPEPKPWEVGFTDCHKDSNSVAHKWRTVLTDEEKEAFANNPACQRVVEAYGLPEE